MKTLLRNPTYVKLLAAQIVALSGTGLLTVALGLLAYDLAGAQAGLVLGIAYTIKMLAYVGLSPIAQAVAVRLPRKAVLVGADLLRAVVALALPFVDALWQVYALIFLLQAASATFTPAYQATLPDVLPDEADYTRALSLSRLCYDLENLTSPALAGLLLGVMSYSGLFLGTVAGFLGSAALVMAARLPALSGAPSQAGFIERATEGLRIYLATPRLRGLLALNLAGAAGGAFVLVNTVVLVRAGFGGSDRDLAVAMACFGAGSMAAALALPRVLLARGDRPVMLAATIGLVVLMAATSIWLWRGMPTWPLFLGLWAGLGALYSGILTPSGRLIRRSGAGAELPALFAAHFALSHACWLLTYPLAGWAGSALGMGPALCGLTLLALGGLVAALRLWPVEVSHRHPDLPPDHPHLRGNGAGAGHAHALSPDSLHRHLTG